MRKCMRLMSFTSMTTLVLAEAVEEGVFMTSGGKLGPPISNCDVFSAIGKTMSMVLDSGLISAHLPHAANPKAETKMLYFPGVSFSENLPV